MIPEPRQNLEAIAGNSAAQREEGETGGKLATPVLPQQPLSARTLPGGVPADKLSAVLRSDGVERHVTEALTLLSQHEDSSDKGETRTIPPLARTRASVDLAEHPQPHPLAHKGEPGDGELEDLPRRKRPTGLLHGALIDGKYRVVRELGRGGMGIVYLAEDVALNRSVAVKVLLPRYARTGHHAERFRREARMLAAIEDENVVHIHALGDHEGLPYLVMDYVMGDTLSAFLSGLQATYEVIPLDLAYSIARQIGRALSAVHAAGIVHRDVKPGNIMITTGPRAILMDFSLARDTATSYSGTHMVGTPDYVAPEQIRGRVLSGREGQRSDIYSLGVTLFETLTGELPFQGTDAVSVLDCHLHQPPPRPSEVRPDLPPSLDPVLLRALAKDPADRWPTCDELVEALHTAYRAARGCQKRRVLIASEHLPQAQTLCRMVGAWLPSTDLTSQKGGQGVVEEVQRYQPALVILDLPMEAEDELGALDLCSALRGDPLSCRIPVIVLCSADSRAADRHFLRMLGVRAVINKPVDPVRLATLVRVLVSGDAAGALA